MLQICSQSIFFNQFEAITPRQNQIQIMKAIVTKYLSATNSRGSRIKASAEGVKSITAPLDYELDDEVNHESVAIKLCEKYGWATELVGGALPNGKGYAFCFVNQ